MKKDNKKRALILWAVILLAVVCACVTVYLLLPGMLSKSDDAGKIEYYNPNHVFYKAEWGVAPEDKEEYALYLEYDRYIHVKEGNVTVGMTEENSNSFRKEELFFKDYFAAVMAGDADAYNALLAPEFIASGGAKEEFTPQMIYDITIERTGSSFIAGSSSYTFTLYYKIFRNDGTFRDDVYSDAERPLYITLVTESGTFKISDIRS